MLIPNTRVGETWNRARCSQVARTGASGLEAKQLLRFEEAHLADVVVDLVVDAARQHTVTEEDAFTPVSDPKRAERKGRDHALTAQTVRHCEPEPACGVALERILLFVDSLVCVLGEDPARFDFRQS